MTIRWEFEKTTLLAWHQSARLCYDARNAIMQFQTPLET